MLWAGRATSASASRSPQLSSRSLAGLHQREEGTSDFQYLLMAVVVPGSSHNFVMASDSEVSGGGLLFLLQIQCRALATGNKKPKMFDVEPRN